MSGRRRYPRYVISNCVGTVRVVSDVTVQQDARGDLIAISDQPRTCGEVLTIELMNVALVRTPVCVAENRPIVEHGSIRHRLRLVRRELDCGSMTADRADAPPVLETDEPSV
jgi:hypothetical protein